MQWLPAHSATAQFIYSTIGDTAIEAFVRVHEIGHSVRAPHLLTAITLPFLSREVVALQLDPSTCCRL